MPGRGVLLRVRVRWPSTGRQLAAVLTFWVLRLGGVELDEAKVLGVLSVLAVVACTGWPGKVCRALPWT